MCSLACSKMPPVAKRHEQTRHCNCIPLVKWCKMFGQTKSRSKTCNSSHNSWTVCGRVLLVTGTRILSKKGLEPGRLSQLVRPKKIEPT